MRSIESTAVHSPADADIVQKAVEQLRLARSFADAVHLHRTLFEDAEAFDAWRSTTADLYYMLLHVCTARIALDMGCDTKPEDLMRYLDGIEGGRLVNRFVAPDAPQDLRDAPAISKAVVTGTLLRQIKQTADNLAAHPDRRIREEASILQLTVQSIALVFADVGAGLLIAAGLAEHLGLRH